MSRIAIVGVVVIGLASAASAEMITFVHEGNGSGTLDGSPFNAGFVITAIGDTGDRFPSFADVWVIPHLSAVIEIDGLGIFDFIDSTRTFVNNANMTVGLSRGGGSDLFNGPVNSAFSAWDLLSSIGPISGGGQILQWGSGLDTSGGVLDFDDSLLTGGVTFTATVVPAPGAGALLALGGVLASRRRRR